MRPRKLLQKEARVTNVNSLGTVLFFPAEIIELTNWLNMLKSHNKLSAIAFAKN